MKNLLKRMTFFFIGVVSLLIITGVLKVEAYYVNSPSFTVTIPSSVSLLYNSSTGKWTNSLSVPVSANISTGDSIKITCPTTLNLSDGLGKTSSANVTFGTNGTVTFLNGSGSSSLVVSTANDNMYAGTWTGSLIFTVSKTTHTHSYISTVTTPPDYGVPGVRTYTCSICGYQYSEEIPALPYLTATQGETYIETINGISWTATGLDDGTVSLKPTDGSQITSSNIDIPPDVKGYKVTVIDDDAFSICTSFVSVVIPNGVTSIGKYAFYGNYNLTSVTLPTSLISIGSDAFDECIMLSSITIPSSVKMIGGWAFAYAQTIRMRAPDSFGMTLENGWAGSAVITWGYTGS